MRYLIFLLLLMPLVYGFESGETAEVFILPNCYGEALVRVDPINQTAGNDYELVDCTKTSDRIWSCECNGARTIYLKSFNYTKNIYNLRTEYFISKMTTADYDISSVQPNKRMEKSKIIIGLDPPPPKQPFKFPELGGNAIVVIVVIIVVVIGIIITLIIFGIGFVMKDDKNKIEGEEKNNAPYKVESASDTADKDELESYLKGL